MTLLERLRLIDRAHSMIKRKGTGPPSEFAERLGISERSLYNLLDLMRRMDAPIEYNNFRQSYYYEEEVELNIGFDRIRNVDEIKGGRMKIFHRLKNSCSELLYI